MWRLPEDRTPPTNRLSLFSVSNLGLGRRLVPGRLLEEDKQYDAANTLNEEIGA